MTATMPAATGSEEWLAVVVSTDGRIQYIASAGQRRAGRTFTAYRGSAARFESEPAALGYGHIVKEHRSRRGPTYPWIADIRAEQIR